MNFLNSSIRSMSVKIVWIICNLDFDGNIYCNSVMYDVVIGHFQEKKFGFLAWEARTSKFQNNGRI